MHRSQLAVVGLVVAVAACTDSSTPTGPSSAPRLMPNGASSLHINANPACTHHWASAVNGSFFDNTKWSPAIVPGASDVACVDAAGTYTVTLDPVNDATPVDLTGLNIGGASGTQTLNLSSISYLINVTQNIEIGANGKLGVQSGSTASVVTVGGALVNQGVVAESGSGVKTIRGDIDNQGTITIGSGLTWDKVNGAYANTGTISMPNAQIIIPASAGAPTFAMNGGSISGSANFSFLGMQSGTFTLNGGSVAALPNTRPSVQLSGANLVLASTATATNAVAVAGTTSGTVTVSGDVGANTTLWITGPGAAQVASINYTGDPIVAGTLKVDVNSFQATSLTILGSGTLRNQGTVVQVGSPIHYAMGVNNTGTFNLGGTAYFDKAGATYDNSGTIGPFFDLQVIGSTLINRTGGTITSTCPGCGVTIDGGHLRGVGSLPRVITQNGGSVEPGIGIGTMTLFTFTPTSTGTFGVELGGTQAGVSYDQLQASNSATLAGSMAVSESGGFQSGVCGQVFDVLTTPTQSATFGSVTGLTPSATRALRVVYQTLTTPRKVTLVGYNPTTKVSIAPNPVAVTEGQTGVQYAVCLDHAPTGNVTVTPTGDAQVSVQPASLVFTPSNWQFPQFFTATAVDDAIIEAPHTGTITHAVTSPDASYNGTPVAAVTANITDNDGSADLMFKISSPPPPLTVGQVFSVGFTVTNNGPTLSTGSSVNFQPVGGFQFQSASGATCTGSASGLTCQVPGVASGGQAVFTLTLKATQHGVFQKTMTVTGQQADPNLANNTLVRNLTIN